LGAVSVEVEGEATGLGCRGRQFDFRRDALPVRPLPHDRAFGIEALAQGLEDVGVFGVFCEILPFAWVDGVVVEFFGGGESLRVEPADVAVAVGAEWR